MISLPTDRRHYSGSPQWDLAVPSVRRMAGRRANRVAWEHPSSHRALSSDYHREQDYESSSARWPWRPNFCTVVPNTTSPRFSPIRNSRFPQISRRLLRIIKRNVSDPTIRRIKIFRQVEKVFEPYHIFKNLIGGGRGEQLPLQCLCKEKKNTRALKYFLGGGGGLSVIRGFSLFA